MSVVGLLTLLGTLAALGAEPLQLNVGLSTPFGKETKRVKLKKEGLLESGETVFTQDITLPVCGSKTGKPAIVALRLEALVSIDVLEERGQHIISATVEHRDYDRIDLSDPAKPCVQSTRPRVANYSGSKALLNLNDGQELPRIKASEDGPSPEIRLFVGGVKNP